MKLICEKYKKTFEAAEAVCVHLEEYCKFRESCIVNFMTRERQREERRKGRTAEESNPEGGENSDHG